MNNLPLAIEEVTASWLSAALGAEVAEVETTGIIWGTATKVLLQVRYAADSIGLPKRICVKGGFVPDLLAIMAPGYQDEARFYRDIAPLFGAGLPHCWYAEIDEETGQGIVVLEDLAAAGVRFCDAREPLRPGQVFDGLRLLATLHGTTTDASWLSGTPYFRPMVSGLLAPEHWDAHVGTTDSDAVRAVLTDRSRIATAFERLWAGEDSRPHVLIHGDANLTNVCLDADGTPSFVDWQFVCRGDAAHDVALFVIGALSVDDRRTHERALVREYLKLRRGDVEDENIFWNAYRAHAIHGACYALTPDAMQPAPIRAALAERYAVAMQDLGTLDLLAP
jgi:aminoglycoside phosphotransferase (APT) family kinase protein